MHPHTLGWVRARPRLHRPARSEGRWWACVALVAVLFSSGQTNVPESATNAIAVAAGDAYSVVLRRDGTVVAWSSYETIRTIPESATNVVAIAAGPGFPLALRSDGTPVAWNGAPRVPASATNVVAVAVGRDFYLAARDDGVVLTWGSANVSKTKIPSAAVPLVALAAGLDFTYGLQPDGRLRRWGRATTTPLPFPAGSNLVSLAAWDANLLALQSDGSVVGWGKDADGQATHSANATNVVAVAAGTDHSLAVRADGSVVGWGRDWFGQATVPANATNAVAVAAGWGHAARELVASAEFYDGRRPGLGDEFLSEIDATVFVACSRQRAGRPEPHGAHSLRTKRFPFRVIFAVQPEQIWIVAVAHLSRRPGYWSRRFT